VFDLTCKTFDRQQKKAPYTRDLIRRLYSAAEANGAAQCFAAKDAVDRVHAACLLVWDNKKSYYLAAGADSNLRNSGAQSFLIWHSIQFCAGRTKVFDFEGSVLENIERAFRGFGAKQITYNWIMKFPLWAQAYLVAR